MEWLWLRIFFFSFCALIFIGVYWWNEKACTARCEGRLAERFIRNSVLLLFLCALSVFGCRLTMMMVFFFALFFMCFVEKRQKKTQIAIALVNKIRRDNLLAWSRVKVLNYVDLRMAGKL